MSAKRVGSGVPHAPRIRCASVRFRAIWTRDPSMDPSPTTAPHARSRFGSSARVPGPLLRPRAMPRGPRAARPARRAAALRRHVRRPDH